jgi:iron complex outermembrane receptor protein
VSGNWAAALLLAAQEVPPPEPAPADPPAAIDTRQARATENAVTQAEDAFGFTIGRETLGLYTSSNVRGFSPLAAGNVRIEGLYFDQFFGLTARVRQSTVIRVGLSAQGYPFPSPTGIVDYRLRKPGDEASLSMLASVDSYGAATIEADAVVPLVPGRLSLGIGAYGARNSFFNGTDSLSHNQGIMLRWQLTPEAEIIPFWTRSQVYDDEQGPIYVPAGPFLPPPIRRRRFDGPEWADYAGVATTQGVLASVAPGQDWLLRAGLFRSLFDDTSIYSHLLTDLQPDGSARRLIIADPRSRFVSVSGEVRLTRRLVEGPRVHLFHLSGRARDRRQRYDGADAVDFGPTRIGDRFDAAQPAFTFGEQTRDVVRQWTAGVAYEGRWSGVGELGFGISRTDYEKRVELPGLAPATTASTPWLYNVSGAAYLSSRLALYGSYARGLEESGVAPASAVNRNEPLAAILTTQWDAGFRYALNDGLKLIAGVFELEKPYFNLDQANRFALLGDVRNRGVEMSLSGALTPRLNIVAGAVLLRPRVTGEGVTLGRVGPRPVGLPVRSIELNADWRPAGLEGLSFDLGISHTSSIPATRDNRVSLPDRTLIDLGARYRFRLGSRGASLRIQISNITNVEGFELRGAGAYDNIPGRVATAYLTVDF